MSYYVNKNISIDIDLRSHGPKLVLARSGAYGMYIMHMINPDIDLHK